MCELGGGTQKALWQLCQLVFVEPSVELRDKQECEVVHVHVDKDQTAN